MRLAPTFQGTFLLMALALDAWGRETGTSIEQCSGCHYGKGGLRPAITLEASVMDAAPGATVDLVVRVSEASANAAGVFASASDGQLTSEDGSLRVEGPGMSHAEPRYLGPLGATFNFQLTLPQTVAVTRFNVSSVLAIQNKNPEDDSFVAEFVDIAHGCEAQTYYQDRDGDGFGDQLTRQRSCDPIPGAILEGGDCADNDAARFPFAPEACNVLDDDCDGAIDNGLSPGLLYADQDGDGYGRGAPEFGCFPAPGYATLAGDCNDQSELVLPAAQEICNGIDDDCDGDIDNQCVEEASAPTCAVFDPGRPSNWARGSLTILLPFLLWRARQGRSLRVGSRRGL